MQKLNIIKFGKGPELALLHGWGSSSKIWQNCIHELSQNFRLWCVDLPGHGDSHTIKWDGSIEQGVELLAQSLPSTCSIIGWSLGGLAAQLYTASYPQRVKKLMLIASVPRFTISEQWPHGMNESTFLNFYNQFERAPVQTLKIFSTLQILNSENSREALSLLTESMSDQDQYINSIKWGLQWLHDVDMREEKTLQEVFIDLLHGENDQVLSIRAAEQTTKIWKQAHLEKFTDAGHVPFISHPKKFLKHIVERASF